MLVSVMVLDMLATGAGDNDEEFIQEQGQETNG
jgi:hypothetical protein